MESNTIFLVQVHFRAEVLSTPSSTQPGFELMTCRSWQHTSCHRDACSNHSAISDLIQSQSRWLPSSETSWVMLLDNKHCEQANDENWPWDDIDIDKVYYHLKPAQENHKLSNNIKNVNPPKMQLAKVFVWNSNAHRVAHSPSAPTFALCHGDHPKIHQQSESAPLCFRHS